MCRQSRHTPHAVLGGFRGRLLHHPLAFPLIVVLTQPDRDQPRDTRLLHRDPVETVRFLHRHLVVRYDDELCVLREIADYPREPPHVRVVERGIDDAKAAAKVAQALEGVELTIEPDHPLPLSAYQLPAAVESKLGLPLRWTF